MNGPGRGALGRGLLVLGAAGMALNTILLGLDWIAFDDRSNIELALLGAGAVLVCAGGALLRSARSTAVAVLAGLFFAALFLFAAAGFAWLRSGYFFPARSRWLLRCALAALLLCGGTLAVGELRRRRALSRSPP